MRAIVSLLSLARLHSCASGIVLVVVGFHLAGGSSWGNLALGALAIALLIAGANGYNDVMDREADAISSPSRPIPSGAVPWRTALVVSVSWLVSGVVCGLAAGWRSGLFAAVLAVVSVVYSSHVKRIVLVGNVWVAVTSACAVLFGAQLVGVIPWLAVIPFGAVVLYMAAFEIVKTIRDQDADRMADVRTAVHAWGIRGTARLGTFILFLSLLWLVVNGWLFAAAPAYFVLWAGGTAVVAVALNDLAQVKDWRSPLMRRALRSLRLAQIPLLGAMFLL